MPVTNRNEGYVVSTKMKALAGFISHMESEEIWELLDALFPNMTEPTKEDLHDIILASQFSNGDITEGRPAEDVFADLERERGLVE